MKNVLSFRWINFEEIGYGWTILFVDFVSFRRITCSYDMSIYKLNTYRHYANKMIPDYMQLHILYNQYKCV